MYKVVSEKKANSSNKKIITNIACGLISITAIVCSLSPNNTKEVTQNNIFYEEDIDDSRELKDKDTHSNVKNNIILTEKVTIPEIALSELETIEIKMPEDKELSSEQKLYNILIKHNITEFEFFQIVSTVAHEAGANNYNECYDVITTMYNRTLSIGCCNFVKAINGKDGTNIINQITCKGQFAGFLPNEAGFDKEKFVGTAAYEATIDFLYSEERSHNYLSFNAPWYDGCPSYAVQLNPECKGNKYFNELTKEDLNQKAIDNGVNLGVSR